MEVQDCIIPARKQYRIYFDENELKDMVSDFVEEDLKSFELKLNGEKGYSPYIDYIKADGKDGWIPNNTIRLAIAKYLVDHYEWTKDVLLFDDMIFAELDFIAWMGCDDTKRCRVIVDKKL